MYLFVHKELSGLLILTETPLNCFVYRRDFHYRVHYIIFWGKGGRGARRRIVTNHCMGLLYPFRYSLGLADRFTHWERFLFARTCSVIIHP
jgi:hypothetical protein